MARSEKARTTVWVKLLPPASLALNLTSKGRPARKSGRSTAARKRPPPTALTGNAAQPKPAGRSSRAALLTGAAAAPCTRAATTSTVEVPAGSVPVLEVGSTTLACSTGSTRQVACGSSLHGSPFGATGPAPADEENASSVCERVDVVVPAQERSTSSTALYDAVPAGTVTAAPSASSRSTSTVRPLERVRCVTGDPSGDGASSPTWSGSASVNGARASPSVLPVRQA